MGGACPQTPLDRHALHAMVWPPHFEGSASTTASTSSSATSSFSAVTPGSAPRTGTTASSTSRGTGNVQVCYIHACVWLYVSTCPKVFSPDQICHAYPVVLSKHRVWTLPLGNLGPNHKAYWHVVTPIRLLRELSFVSKIMTPYVHHVYLVV